MRVGPYVGACPPGESDSCDHLADVAGRPGRSRRPRAAATVLTVWIFTTVALVARGIQLFLPGGLLGVTEYDDGVYFGAALRLTQGLLPYRSFVLVQPPGVPLLMTPLALLAHVIGTDWGLATARIITVVVGATNVYLLGRLLSHRGTLTVVVSCGILSVFSAAVMAAHTLLLEPYLNFACLVGFGLLFDGDRVTVDRSRLIWAGVAFGVAGAIKAWAILPVVVILIVLALHSSPDGGQSRWTSLGRFAGGVTAGFLVPCLPFLITAPSAFVREVVTDQLVRVAPTRTPVGTRLSYLAGLHGGYGGHHLPTLLLAGATLVVGGGLIAGTVPGRARSGPDASHLIPPGVAATEPIAGRTLEITMAAVSVVVFVAFLWPANFYYHYGAFFAPWLAASVGLALGRLHVTLLPGSGGLARITQASLVVLVVGAVVFFLSRPTDFGQRVSPVIDRLVPPGACVVTDESSITVAANRFLTSVPGCPAVIDSFGTVMALSGGDQIGSGASHDRRLQHFWMASFTRADYVVLSGANSWRIPWSPALRRLLREQFRLVHRGGVTIWARDGLPA